ncbi:MAG: flagellar export protein FliJ [Phycisphaerales bacterium]|nr:flagellar export protein FliJ [Phycisphaerales bacterium]
MAKFVFKFASVLRHREQVEDQRQRELAQQLRMRMILMSQLQNMQQDISTSKQNLAGSLVGKVDLDQVGQFARFAGQTTVRARQLVGKLAVVEKQVEEARVLLLQATAQRKAMELLRDRHHEIWRSTLDRRETAQLDELAMQSHAREHMLNAAADK